MKEGTDLTPALSSKERGNKEKMHLETLELFNFRNYSHLQVKFDPKINLILGENGSGKTNLLEAIFF
ncbi:MAG: recombination protein F [candidate division Zixibacteria bacterium RBG-1]|nr:MAG: recombination protein F [candidate division Zixibacteria bacterium RBG-1]OGC85020.1 MAG: hypothetical protein A2V73_03145 [candidate division Zixibacteria bacterium RBG_19FT_COMBO_42_43]